VKDGVSLDAVEGAGFEVIITTDQEFPFQQNLQRRRIATVRRCDGRVRRPLVYASQGLGCNKTAVVRYRLALESRQLPPSTITLACGVRRLAFEAVETGLLSPKLPAGMRRVKGAKRARVRTGN
jgi:hypothetical protein